MDDNHRSVARGRILGDRSRVFNLNGLRPDCKMDYWALARDLLVGKRNQRPSSPGPLISPPSAGRLQRTALALKDNHQGPR